MDVDWFSAMPFQCLVLVRSLYIPQRDVFLPVFAELEAGILKTLSDPHRAIQAWDQNYFRTNDHFWMLPRRVNVRH